MGGPSEVAAPSSRPCVTRPLICIVAICPDNGSVLGEKPPAELTPSVPVLFVCGENDTDAPPQAHAWAHYRKTGDRDTPPPAHEKPDGEPSGE